MNKKLRILLCSVLSVFTIFAFAFTGCDETGADSSGSTSDSTTDTSDSTAHTHTYDYSNITWNWSSDYSSVTASVPCIDGDDTLTVEAKDITITENVITEATKLAKGSSTYTASFTVVDGTPYSYTTDEVETPATATVYDPAYLEDMTAGSAIAKDTSIFGGFATVVGEKFYYTTLGENDTLVYEDEIVSDYEFSSRLYIFNSTEDQLSFTLTSDATVTFYLGINSNNSQTLIIKNSEGEAVHTTETSYATTTTTSGQNYVFAEEVELEAGTYTLAASYANYYALCLYGIVVEGDDYTDGIWNYTAPSGGDEGGETNNTFELAAETDYTFTATETATYTFTISGDANYACIYAGKSAYDSYNTALLDVQNDESYSFTYDMTAGDTLTLYLIGSDGVTVTYTTGSTSGGETGGDETAISLTVGENSIVLTSDTAYGTDATFTAPSAGVYTFSVAGGSNSDVYIGDAEVEIYAYSYGNSGMSASFILTEGQVVPVTLATYNWSAGSYTLNIERSDFAAQTLTASETATTLDIYSSVSNSYTYSAYVSFSANAGDTYYITLSTDSSYLSYNTITVTANDTEITGSDYNYNITAVDGTNSVVISFSGYYVYPGTYTYTAALTSGKYTPLETSIPTLTTGDNEITLSSSDASGKDTTFKASADGVYTFSIASTDTTAYVELPTTTLRVTGYSYNTVTTVTYILSADDEIDITLGTNTGLSGKYTLTIAKTDTADIEYQSLTTTASALTLYSDGTENTYYAYVTSAATGEHYITLTCNSSNGLYNLTVTVSVGGTVAEGANNNYNVTLSGSDKIVITLSSTSTIYTSYTYSAAITEGTYTVVDSNVPETLSVGTNTVVVGTAALSSGVSSTFTASELGLYTFSIASDADAKVTVGSTTLSSSKTSVSYALAANESVTVKFAASSSTTASSSTYVFTIEKGSVTTSTLVTDTAVDLTFYSSATSSNICVAYATYTATATGNYVITLSSTYGYFTSYASLTVLVNGTAASGDGLQVSLATVSGETYTLIISSTYVSTSSDYTYSATIAEGTIATSSIPETLAATNEVTLTASGASNGVVGTYTLAAGTYTISISASEDAYITIESSNYSVYSYMYSSGYTTSYTFTLDDETVIYITYKTDSYSAGTYHVYVEGLTGGSSNNVLELDTEYTLDASITYTFTPETTGTYNITVNTAGDVLIYNDELSFNEDVYNGASKDVTLTAGVTYSVTCYNAYYDGSIITITFKGASGDSGSDTDVSTVPTPLVVGDNTIYVTASDSNGDGVSSTFTASVAGTYTFSISSTADAYVKINNGYLMQTGDSTSQEIELSANQTVTVEFWTYSYSAATYTLTITAPASGDDDDEGTTTTIASVDFTTFTSNTLSTTADAAFEDLKLEDGTDTGFDVIGKISSGSETVASIKSQNSVMSLNFGGACTYTAATEEGSEATVSSAIRYYLTAGTYTVTVSYFSIATDTSNDKDGSGRYAIVRGSDGTILSDTVTDAEKTDGVQTIITREMEITVSADGYIYIGSASSGLYISAITITQTTTTAE